MAPSYEWRFTDQGYVIGVDVWQNPTIEIAKLLLYRAAEFDRGVLTSLLKLAPQAQEAIAGETHDWPELVPDHLFRPWLRKYHLESNYFWALAEYTLHSWNSSGPPEWAFTNPLEEPPGRGLRQADRNLEEIQSSLVVNVPWFPLRDGLGDVSARAHAQLKEALTGHKSAFERRLREGNVDELIENGAETAFSVGHEKVDLRYVDWLMLKQLGYSYAEIHEWAQKSGRIGREGVVGAIKRTARRLSLAPRPTPKRGRRLALLNSFSPMPSITFR